MNLSPMERERMRFMFAADETKWTLLEKLEKRRPEVVAPRCWLHVNTTIDVIALVEQSNERLRRRGHFLKVPHLWTYLRKVVIGSYLIELRKKLAVMSKEEREQSCAEEFTELQLAVMALADGKSFEKNRKRMVREKQATQLRVHLGDNDDFEGYVAKDSTWITHKFLDNFNPGTTSAYKAVRYLETIATSAYLSR